MEDVFEVEGIDSDVEYVIMLQYATSKGWLCFIQTLLRILRGKSCRKARDPPYSKQLLHYNSFVH